MCLNHSVQNCAAWLRHSKQIIIDGNKVDDSHSLPAYADLVTVAYDLIHCLCNYSVTRGFRSCRSQTLLPPTSILLLGAFATKAGYSVLTSNENTICLGCPVRLFESNYHHPPGTKEAETGFNLRPLLL